jgi:hypothetical protein
VLARAPLRYLTIDYHGPTIDNPPADRQPFLAALVTKFGQTGPCGRKSPFRRGGLRA